MDATKICALSYTRRWFYIIADHVCKRMDVQLGVGTHIPENLANIASNVGEDFWDDETPGASNRNSETVEPPVLDMASWRMNPPIQMMTDF